MTMAGRKDLFHIEVKPRTDQPELTLYTSTYKESKKLSLRKNAD
jgi:hypothetical protein